MPHAKAPFLEARDIRTVTEHVHLLRVPAAKASFLINDVGTHMFNKPTFAMMSQAGASMFDNIQKPANALTISII